VAKMGVFVVGVLDVAAIILYVIQMRRLPEIEQRERQFRVTRKKWLLRRYVQLLAAGLVCGSLSTLLLKEAAAEKAGGISTMQLWLNIVLAIMLLGIVYDILTLTGKLWVISIGMLILVYGIVMLLIAVVSVLEKINIAAGSETWLLSVFLFAVLLVLSLVYSRCFRKKDLKED
jgi:hypothetical protein